MSALPFLRQSSARLAQSLLGASIAALGAACLDAALARAQSPTAKLPSLSLYLADLGLIAPVALVLGLFMGVLGLVVDPAFPPSPRRMAAALRLRAVGRPADVAAFVPLATLGAFFWMTFSAHLARALLGLSVSPGLSGVAIASAALGAGCLTGLFVLALTPPLRRALATASDGRPAFVDPAVTLAVALTLVGALFAIGVNTGGVSGERGFLGIYGIFKRPELDLRAPALALALALSAFLAPAILGRRSALVALVLALAPLILTVRAATALNDAPFLATALDRGAPLGKPALALLRKLTDRDHDGVSGLFGGGDCNDHDPRINPLAEDIPDNGIDEDCSGADFHLSSPAPSSPTPAPAPAPSAVVAKIPPDLNVILITIDTLRADLGYAGNPRPLSPNLDKLAARSIVFDHAYSLASYTGKSVGPMLIGKYGSETHRNWGHSNSFSKEDTFVAERLSKAGIHTVSVQALRYFGRQSGMDRGFDKIDMSAAPAEGLIKDMETSVTGDKLSDAAIALLKSPEHTGQRFFFWMHYLDCHADYIRHEEMPSFGTTQRDLYDGEVAFVDKHLGRVLDTIAAEPFARNTAIIITSDHGEAFGEHKMVRHGAELWEELVHVPLIVYVPGLSPAHIKTRRSAIDLTPTLLDLFGQKPPPPLAPGEKGNDFVSGVSLVPDLTLAPGASPAPRDVFIDMPDGPYNDPRRSLLHGDLKLTVSNGGSFELFDLAKDPDERQNLWDDPEQAKLVRPYYEAARARLHEIRVTGEKK